jgi:hypothetical protein
MDSQLALKEWAIAIEALVAGKMVLLLRKGGIREARFAIDRPEFWLYPTYEHQKPELLKADYANRVVSVESGWHPTTVPIQARARVTHEFELMEQSQLDALLPFHIWNEQFAEMRLKWKPRSPLTVVLLRVFRLMQPVEIAFDSSYGGCKSWLNLQEQLDRSALVPVLTDEDYDAIVRQIIV